MEPFEVPQSLMDKVCRVLNESEVPSSVKETWEQADKERTDRKKTLKTNNEEKEQKVVDESKGEKIFFNPSVYPDRINSDNAENNKTQKTV